MVVTKLRKKGTICHDSETSSGYNTQGLGSNELNRLGPNNSYCPLGSWQSKGAIYSRIGFEDIQSKLGGLSENAKYHMASKLLRDSNNHPGIGQLTRELTGIVYSI